ncbi:hypothetical protein O9929_11245 [Vibrio lentus]|nr:hypothetical protein [Vibrio lentus]
MDLNLSLFSTNRTVTSPGSRLTLSINDQFIQAFNLTTEGQGGDSNRMFEFPCWMTVF